MAQGTIGLRFNVDVGNSPAQVENLTNTVATLNEELAKATEDKDWKAIAMLTKAIEDTTSARGRIMQQANQAQSQQAKENMKSGGIFSRENSDVGRYLMAQSLTKLTETVVSALEKGFKAAEQRASGDYAGAAISEMEGNAGLINGGTGLAAGIAGLIFSGGNPFVAGLASQITEKIVGYFTGKSIHEVQAGLAYSAEYKKALPSIDALNQNFGGAINKKTLEENNAYGLAMYGRAAEATEGTGLTTQQFVEAMKQMGGYGIDSETKALNMAQNQALWSRFTGADLSTIQKYAGQAYRYGGETGAVSTAYGGLMAQGMGKAQMTEYLNAVGHIMEESISKGFVKSAEEIAGNMQMLYKLSGGSSLWQGEQGAQRYSQMSNAISNATNLQSVEDVISFGVARDYFDSLGADAQKILLEGEDRKKNDKGGRYTGTYVDYMQLLERGVDANLLKGQFEAVSRLEGNNVAGIIERFRSMYGLNYTGAAQVYDMMDRAKDKDGNFNFDAKDFAKQIKEMSTKPEFMSDSALLTTALNKMGNNLANIGKIHFDATELKVLEQQAADVAAIRAKLVNGTDEIRERKEAVYLPKVDAAWKPLNNTISTLIDDRHGMASDAATFNLNRLSSGAGQSKDRNNQMLGEMYNNDIFPRLETLKESSMTEEIIDAVYQVQKLHSDAVSGMGKRALVDDSEYQTVYNALQRLIEALDKNTDRRNTSDDKINVYLSEF